MKRALIVVVGSVLLGTFGLYLVAGKELFSSASYDLPTWNPRLVFLCVASLLVSWSAPGLKLSILARVQGSKLPFVQALYVHIVMTFGAALTPGNSGGAPLAAITLNRLGIPLGQGISIAVQTIVLDLIFYAWTVPVSLVYLLVSDQLHIATGALYMAFLLVALLVVLAVVLVFYPRPLVRSLLWLSSKGVFRRFRQPLAKASREYYRSTRRFQALPLRDWLVLDVVTAVGWLANFVLFWALLVLFDNHARAPVVVAYLDLIQLVGNIVPTPGASGYMEAVVGLSTTNAQQETVSVAAPLLLWRLASFYVVFLLGPLASALIWVSNRPPNGRSDQVGSGGARSSDQQQPNLEREDASNRR